VDEQCTTSTTSVECVNDGCSTDVSREAAEAPDDTPDGS
jgi:hypothetical protein